jgi:hypothetical protein
MEVNFMKVKCRIFLLILLTGVLSACVSGQYMKIKSTENPDILGTVQSTFVINSSFRYRSVINRQAYINLLAEAQKIFPDDNVDIQDISWVIGKQLDSPNYEYTALGKVIRLFD